jgi:phosphoribosylaminoimidazole-succinocarboxamide synthase
LKLLRKGKVRDIYDLDDRLLIVASDRISAYDCVLPDRIPGKGEALNQLSEFWFRKTRDTFPNHFIDTEGTRSMIVTKADRIDIEWICRGYLYGSMWRQYQAGQRMFCDLELPENMRLAEQLPEVLLTPTTKSDVGHDEDISKDDAIRQGLVTQNEWIELEEATFQLYDFYKEEARKRGLIIPDFKIEYGRVDEEIIQIDEAPTHDSARFWAEQYYRPGEQQEGHALDKEFLRVILREAYDFTGDGQPPMLPAQVIEQISRRCTGVNQVMKGKRKIDDLDLMSVTQVMKEIEG